MVHRGDAVPDPCIQGSDMNQAVMDRWTAVKRIHPSDLDRDPSERAALLTDTTEAETKKGDFERVLTEDLKRSEARAPDEETRADLEQIYADVLQVHLAVAPQWDSLRGDPRFECLGRMKLRPVS